MPNRLPSLSLISLVLGQNHNWSRSSFTNTSSIVYVLNSQRISILINSWLSCIPSSPVQIRKLEEVGNKIVHSCIKQYTECRINSKTFDPLKKISSLGIVVNSLSGTFEISSIFDVFSMFYRTFYLCLLNKLSNIIMLVIFPLV